MLQRNLIYTGVAGARKLLILIGDSDTLRDAVENNIADTKRIRLKEKLINKFNMQNYTTRQNWRVVWLGF